MNRRLHIAQRFGSAAASYDAHSAAQRHAAQRLAELILARPPVATSGRVLEIGCGTGHLTRALLPHFPHRLWIASDIAAPMVQACCRELPVHGLVMDGERPALAPGFDLICASLSVQWFADLPRALAGLASLLAPGGLLAISSLGAASFREWGDCHRRLGLEPATLSFPDTTHFGAAFPAVGEVRIETEDWLDRPASALEFLHGLRGIGADTPAPGSHPLSAGAMRKVMREFDRRVQAGGVTYQLLYGLVKPPKGC